MPIKQCYIMSESIRNDLYLLRLAIPCSKCSLCNSIEIDNNNFIEMKCQKGTFIGDLSESIIIAPNCEFFTEENYFVLKINFFFLGNDKYK